MLHLIMQAHIHTQNSGWCICKDDLRDSLIPNVTRRGLDHSDAAAVTSPTSPCCSTREPTYRW